MKICAIWTACTFSSVFFKNVTICATSVDKQFLLMKLFINVQ